MSGLWLGYKFGFCEYKQTKKSAQHSEGASMTTRWMREPTKHRPEKKDISRLFKLLDRGINTVHKFSCMHKAVCMHVLCTVVTVHAICEGLIFKLINSQTISKCSQIPFPIDSIHMHQHKVDKVNLFMIVTNG